ncbi:MAG: folylpolyglutamate synthase/dihydrofolate synthase family protein [Planctomycetaceae bacterium]
MADAPTPLPSSGASSPCADIQPARFLLGRIDYERQPPTRSATDAFRLDRMAALLERLGNPQRSVPCVHIAGSKGKGSTAAMLASICRAAGIRTGLFTSPHIERFEERIQLDGVPIPEARFAALLDELRPVTEELDASTLGGPTFFELITALAWLYYREAGAELVVLEVGLGGRLDATNLCRPLVTIIASISRDHTRLLGETLGEIAGEKAGIIKPGVPVLSGVTAPEPAGVIEQFAWRHDAPLHLAGRELSWRAHVADPASRDAPLPRVMVDIANGWRSHRDLIVPLPGEHQQLNTTLSVSAADLLDHTGAFRISPAAIKRGLEETRWPLRIEVVGRHPLLIVDAAHNEASIAGLLKTLSPLPVDRRVLMFAASRDKDAGAMLRQVAMECDELILTRFVGNPRAVQPSELAELLPADHRATIHLAEDPPAALALARQLATSNDLICATGSFFLAAEVRRLVMTSAGQRT